MRHRLLTIVALATALTAWSAGTASAYTTTTTTLDLTPGTVPLPTGTIVTNQFVDSYGLRFIGGAPPQASYNYIQDNAFWNLNTLKFTWRPVRQVTLSFRDSNGVQETHTLTAYNRNGVKVGSASYTETPGGSAEFMLLITTSYRKSQAISYVVESNVPPAAELLTRVSYVHRTL